jgi:hypothetical protein
MDAKNSIQYLVSLRAQERELLEETSRFNALITHQNMAHGKGANDQAIDRYNTLSSELNKLQKEIKEASKIVDNFWPNK